jgi:hypothetical protein
MGLLYAPVAVLVLVLMHWVSKFIFPNQGALSRFVLAFVISAGLLWRQLAAETLSLREMSVIVIWALFLTELYVFTFTLSLGSVSIKILQLLREKPMTVAEIEACYQPESMVNIRFQRLASVGMIEGTGEAPRLTNRGKYVLAVFTFVQKTLHPPHRAFNASPSGHASLK